MKKKYFLIFIILFSLADKLYTQNTEQLIDTAMYFYQEKQYEKSYQAFNNAFIKNETIENQGYTFYCFSIVAEECHKTSVSNQYLKKALDEGVVNSFEGINYLKKNHPLYKKNKQAKDIDSLLDVIYTNLRTVIKRDSLYFLHLQDTAFKIGGNKALTSFLKKLQTFKTSTNNLLDSLTQFNEYPTPPRTDCFVLYLFSGETEIVPYILFIPKKYNSQKKHALYVYLHGGSASIENFSFTEEHATGEPIFKWGKDKNALILYPLGKKSLGWHIGEEAIKNVYGMISQIKGFYNVNDTEISFIGMSNGARGVIYTALHYPKYFKDFIAISSSSDFYKDSLLLNNLTNTYTLNLLEGTDDEVYSYAEHKICFDKINGRNLNLTMTTLNKGNHGFIYTDSGYTFFCENLNKKITNKSFNENKIANSINWSFNNNENSEYQWLKILPSPKDSGIYNVQIEKKGNDFFIKSKSTEKVNVVLQLFYKQIDLTKPICVYNEKNKKIFEQKIILDKDMIIRYFQGNFDRNNILISEIFLNL